MNDRFHELTPEEQAQVSGGISIGAAGTTELRPGQGGHAATAENRFDALAGLTTLQIRQIPFGDSRFQIAQEFLRIHGNAGGNFSGNNGGFSV